MSISNFRRDLHQLKIWMTYGSELLWIRAQMLRLDVITQFKSIILLIAALIFTGVFTFLGFITLLFALNIVLTPQAKIWTFFGIAGLFLLLILILMVLIAKLWRKQSQFMTATLKAINEDISFLKHSNESKEQTHEY
ncbi:MAG: phage holin family protein [Snodgrassella sp.]|nr:phage holin family protein [Snodgrassella sp.]